MTALKTHTVESVFWLGDVVFMRCNKDRKPGMVTRINVGAHGGVTFGVTWEGGADTWHFDCELTAEYVPDYSTQ